MVDPKGTEAQQGLTKMSVYNFSDRIEGRYARLECNGQGTAQTVQEINTSH